VAEAGEADGFCLSLAISTHLSTLQPPFLMRPSISKTSTFAPPCSGPQSALTPPPPRRTNWRGWNHRAHGGRAAILLMVGMQNEQQIQRFLHLFVNKMLAVGHGNIMCRKLAQ